MGAFDRSDHEQLGFGELLAEADTANHRRRFARETADLPGTMAEGIPFFRDLIGHHHAAMLAADTAQVVALRETARLLARKLNGGDTGILAHEDAPGYVLARKTAARGGEIPLWGQTGSFVLETSGTSVRVEMEGIYGIGTFGHWPGFSAHAVDPARPFISGTGYRSFLGVHLELAEGITPDVFAAEIIAAHVRHDLKGKLVEIEERYRARL